MKGDSIIIHTDGGSRGNPGPASCAFVAESDGKIVFKSSRYLGKTTNNVAEYGGVILALEWVAEQLPVGNCQFPIVFYLDSELIVRQINGIYKVKDNNLKNLYNDVLKKLKKIGNNITFKNIPREQNKIADLLVNESLDKNV